MAEGTQAALMGTAEGRKIFDNCAWGSHTYLEGNGHVQPISKNNYRKVGNCFLFIASADPHCRLCTVLTSYVTASIDPAYASIRDLNISELKITEGSVPVYILSSLFSTCKVVTGVSLPHNLYNTTVLSIPLYF